METQTSAPIALEWKMAVLHARLDANRRGSLHLGQETIMEEMTGKRYPA